jgi:fatty acid desaturase
MVINKLTLKPIIMENELSNPNEQPISVGQWMLNMFLVYIPMVNIIMLIIWAVSTTEPQSKVNWARARLMWMAIGIVFMILAWGAIFAFVAASGEFFNA